MTRVAGRGNGGLWKARKTIVPFSALPTDLGNRAKIMPREKLMPGDFHIPSATVAAATMSKFKTRKGAQLLQLTFASFRLILRLEKTGGFALHDQS
jgi:hypothetical protein